MPRLYVDAPLAAGEMALPLGATRHAQVLRLQPGDALVLFDGRGGEWAAEVVRMGRRDVIVQVAAHQAVTRELGLDVTLATVVPANERTEWLVEKATELGAAAFQPLLGERSVLRLVGERAERRVSHWQAVAVAASEQSGRTRVPGVAPLRPLTQWLEGLPGANAGPAAPVWLLDPHEGPSLAEAWAAARYAARSSKAASPATLTLLSGPEGGLSPAEAARARGAGAIPVRLGPRVLRAETAPLAAMAALAALLDAASSPPLESA